MPRKGTRKITEQKKEEIINDWELFPDLTAIQLANMHHVGLSTLEKIVRGKRRYNLTSRAELSLDAIGASGVQVDTEKRVYGLHQQFHYQPLEALDKEPQIEYTRTSKCPHCHRRMKTRQLLKHCIEDHHREDLRYLL